MKNRLLFYAIWVIEFARTTASFGQNSSPQPNENLIKPLINSHLNERDLAISPDGKEIFYSLVLSRKNAVILCLKTEQGQPNLPQILSFSGKFFDIEPAFSPDGKRLYFASNRSLDHASTKDFDIWYVEKQADGKWGEPQNMGAPVNTPANEFYPSFAQNGNLYFTAKYGQNEDIWLSKFENGKYIAPQALPIAINSSQDEFNAFVSPDEQTLFFSSYGRSDDMGGGDLYISQKDKNGQWQPAQNLKFLNSNRLDYCPYISPDSKYFYFTSEKKSNQNSNDKSLNINQLYNNLMQGGNGLGDIYWLELKSVLTSLGK
jgi:Tol biopolymer transport system component